MYKQRRDAPSKVKAINTMKIEEAMALAKQDERVTDVADAICWIMDRSDYWRSRGSQQILQDVNHAEEFGVELMTDGSGAIIILDARDAVVFLNTLNDDYVESDMTGTHYLIKTKQTIHESGDSQTRIDVR